MNTRGGMPAEDLALLFDYLGGELSAAEEVALERRLADDPELAAEFEVLAEMDFMQRALSAAEAGACAAAPRRGRRPAALVAAALVLGLGAGLWAFFALAGEVPAQFWLVPRDDDIAVVARIHGLPDSVAADVQTSRGPEDPGEATPPSSAEHLNTSLEELELGMDAGSLAAPDTALEAERFALKLQAPYRFSVVVLQVGSSGLAVRSYPRPGKEADPNRFEPGKWYVVPPVRETVGELKAYAKPLIDNSLVAPSRGTTRVLGALRPEAVGPELLAELDELLETLEPGPDGNAAASEEVAARLVRWLEEHGFEVHEQRVSDLR